MTFSITQWRTGRGTGFIIVETFIEPAQVQFVIDQMTQRVLKCTGQQLNGEIDGSNFMPGSISLYRGIALSPPSIDDGILQDTNDRSKITAWFFYSHVSPLHGKEERMSTTRQRQSSSSIVIRFCLAVLSLSSAGLASSADQEAEAVRARYEGVFALQEWHTDSGVFRPPQVEGRSVHLNSVYRCNHARQDAGGHSNDRGFVWHLRTRWYSVFLSI